MFGKKLDKAWHGGYGQGHEVGLHKGFKAGVAHALGLPVDKDPFTFDRQGVRDRQIREDRINPDTQPGSPMDNLYQALKQEDK